MGGWRTALLAIALGGCALEQSGLAVDGGEVAMDAAADDAARDAGPLDAEGADGAPDDAGLPDAGEDAGCPPLRCDGDDLVTCADGTESRMTCPLGCAAAECRRILPSNVGTAVPLDAGGADLDVGGDPLELWIANTDTGEIIANDRDAFSTTPPRIVRTGGEGDIGGIVFRIVPQPDGIDLGVFAIRSLRVRAGALLHGHGTRAIVWLVASDVTIEGTLGAAADVIKIPTAPGPGGNIWYPGPGGGLGGDQCPPCGGGRDGVDGSGPGFGHGGADNADQDGGGGGASFGSSGDDGGRDSEGGSQEDPYGTEELIPLAGGSGGGSGGDNDGGDGGHGGGALQVTAGGRIEVVAGGEVEAGGGGGVGGRSEGGAGDTGGGGGGGSGGGILLEALTVVIEGVVAANGGAGGQGGLSGAVGVSGAPGRAGLVPAPGSDTVDIGGGGGDGSDPDGSADSGGDAENGGGGGGGAGRVRLNDLAGGGWTGMGRILPFPSSGLATGGPLGLVP